MTGSFEIELPIQIHHRFEVLIFGEAHHDIVPLLLKTEPQAGIWSTGPPIIALQNARSSATEPALRATRLLGIARSGGGFAQAGRVAPAMNVETM